MELERTMRYRIIDIAFEAICGHNMIDFVMSHSARANIIQTAEYGEHDDEHQQKLFNGQGLPPRQNRFIQPVLWFGGRCRVGVFRDHSCSPRSLVNTKI